MATPFANEDLSALLDDELSPEDQAMMEAMLDEDPALRDELAMLEEVSALLREHGPVDASSDFEARVLAAVADEPMPSRWWAWLRRPFGVPVEGWALAAAAAMVAVVVLQTQTLGVSEPAPSAESPLAVAQVPIERAPAAQAPVSAPVSEVANDATGAASSADWEQVVAGTKQPAMTPVGTENARSVVSLPDTHFTVTATGTYPVESLAELSRRYGARVGAVDGRSLDAVQLSPGASVELRVQLPFDQLPAFEDALHGLGEVQKRTGEPISALAQAVPVRIVLARAPEADVPAMPAMRSSKRSAGDAAPQEMLEDMASEPPLPEDIYGEATK